MTTKKYKDIQQEAYRILDDIIEFKNSLPSGSSIEIISGDYLQFIPCWKNEFVGIRFRNTAPLTDRPRTGNNI